MCAVESPAFANEYASPGYNAPQTRRAVFVSLAAGGGVVGSGDLLVSAGSGMSVNVAVGQVMVPGYGTNYGQY